MRREQSLWYQEGFTQEFWESLTPAERDVYLSHMNDRQAEEYFRDWRVWARDEQLIPTGNEPGADWNELLAVCGRGWGKTRFAVELLLDAIESTQYPLRIAIVGQGESDIRRVMVEGESGFLNCSKSWNKSKWSPSVGGGTLTWENGSQAFVYSAEDTEALRGPQFHWGWFDEPMAVPADKRERAYANLRFCVRLGEHPRRILTTTPKKHIWMKKKLEDAENPRKKIYVVRGKTSDNKSLAKSFLDDISEEYEGTRLGRQELDGELLTDEEGALWTTDALDKMRLKDHDPEEIGKRCDKIVVAVDPNKEAVTAHAAGIVVIGALGKLRYVLADRSVAGGPMAWGKAAVKAFEDFSANEIVVETNQGGQMCKIVLEQAADALGVMIKVHMVNAQKGKARRAEPVSNVYDQNRVHHVGSAKSMKLLEDQMCSLHEEVDPTGEDFDRLDAMVWGMTRLGVKKTKGGASASAGIISLDTFSGAPTSGQQSIQGGFSFEFG